MSAGEIYIIKDIYIGPEDETATGPNFPRQNQIQVAIAPGQTITNLDVTDLLPSNMQFVSVVETSKHGASTSTMSQSTPSLSTPGGTLTRRFASVTGTGTGNDITMTFQYYIPLNDAASNAVIDANTGSAVTSTDTASAQGTWTPLNPNDSTGTYSSGTATHTLNDRSIATQKTVSVAGGGPVIPGATLQYSIAFQVSDYFALQNLILTDLISDGQHFDPSFTPTLEVNGGTFVLSAAGFNASNFSAVGNFTGAAPPPVSPDGTTTASFNISQEMQTRGQNGRLLGGLVAGGGGSLLTAPGNGTTNSTPISQDAIVQITMTEPFLTVTKAAVASNDPNASFTGSLGPAGFNAPGTSGFRASAAINSNGLDTSPLNSNASGVQAGDLVTFAVVVQNTGTGLHGAFNVQLNDTIPAGFQIPAGGLNLNVSDGAGNSIGYSDLGGGLFGTGIELNDNGSAGSLSAHDPASGHNLVVITYDLQVKASVAPSQTYVNTAGLFNYASKPGGPDFLSAPLYASANASTPNVLVTKQLASSDQGFTAGSNLAIGEVGTYNVALTFPEGVAPSASLVDSLPAGMSLVSLVSIVASSNLSASNGMFSTILSNAAIAANGFSFTLNFGDVTNSDSTLGGSDTIVIQYKAAVLNVASNTQGNSLTNTASLSFTGGSASGTNTVTAVVPKLTVTKSVDNPNAQAGDTVTYTVTIANSAASGSGTDAEDVTLGDVIPSDVQYLAGSLTQVSGVTPTSLTEAGGTVSGTYSAIALGLSTTFTFQAKVLTGVAALTPVVNTANVAYTTLPGTVNTPISPYDANSVERTGNSSDPGGAANNLDASGSASFTPPVGITKTIVSTNQLFTSGPNVAIGEEVVYRLTVTIPQGTTPSVSISDTLPAGLVFAGVAASSFSASLSSSQSGGMAAALASPTFTANVVTWNLGMLTNTDNTSSTAETITIDYNTYVLNAAGNQNGTTLQNNATFTTGSASQSVSAPALNVVVPVLTVTDNVSQSNADIGGAPVTFTIVVFQDATSGTDAFDINLGDVVPSGFTIVAGSLQSSGSAPVSTLTLTGNTIAATYGAIPMGESSTITFQAYLNGTVSPGQTLSDVPAITYSTLSGDYTSPQTANSAVSTERTGNTSNPGGAVNNLAASAMAGVTATSDTITGFVYVDANDDGAKNAGELGLGGVTVTLSGTDNLNNPVLQSTSTNASGLYTFANLLPGSYTVTESQPSASLDGKDTAGSPGGANPSKNVFDVSLPATGSSTTASGFLFGELNPSSLSGNVYLDKNDDGLINASDSGIGGVLVTLTGTDDLGNAVNSVVSTPANGSYNFNGLRPGTYTIVESQPSGFLDGKDTIGAPGGSNAVKNQFSNIVVTSGTTGINNNFGELIASSVAGFVYLDSNNNGAMNAGEPAIGGVSVKLTGTDDLGNSVSNTKATVADGSYSFAGLRPGTYDLTETQPASYLEGQDTLGTLGGSASSQNLFTNLVVTSGTTAADYLFGEQGATLSGTVHIDVNADGAMNNAEVGLFGATLTLKDGGGNSVGTTTTAADGSYRFANLPAGDYSIVETQPNGYGSSTPNTLAVTLPLAGLTRENFSETTSSLAGSVYLDANNDGSRESGESGISGVTVTLTGTDANATPVNLTATTASHGSYRFTGLLSGSYTVTETQPAQYSQGTNALGTAGCSISGDVISAVTLPVGATAAGYLFGEQGATISGTVYVNSRTGMGTIPNAVLTLKNASGQVIGTTTSGSDGTYAFLNLPSGSYTVTVSYPPGYGTNLPTTLPADLTAGEVADLNFTKGTGSLSGVAYFDQNNDGAAGAGEPGIGGVLLTLTGTDINGKSVSLTTATAPNGTYTFTDLLAFTYVVSLTQPAAYLDGKVAARYAGSTVLTNQIASVNLSAGADVSHYDFAELKPASLGGTVYYDYDRNNTLGGSDFGIAHVPVFLRGTDDLGNLVSLSTVTDSTGA